MNWNALEWGILGPALVAGLLVLATHVSLGARVLDKGIVFIDLAIAQIAGLGVIGADALGLPEGGVAVQAAAVTAALVGALLLTWTEKRWPATQEALIGVMFVLASCAGILMLSNNPHGGEHLKDLLVGQILWVGKTQIAWLALVTAVLEPKPGVEPSASHLQEVLDTLKARPAKMVIYSAYQDPKPDEWLSEHARIPAVKLPFTVGGTDGAKDLTGLFDDTVTRLVGALK